VWQHGRAAGLPTHAWSASRAPGPNLPAEVIELRGIIKRVRPDVVHLHSAKAGLAGRLALRGRIPTIYQPHAWSFLAARGVIAVGATYWERLAVKWADMVIAVSQAELRQGIQHGVVPKVARVIPNGVDLERFAPRNRAEARAHLNIGSEPLVVCVGRFTRQKGQDLLLSAWESIAAAVPSAQLVLVGEGPDRDELLGGLAHQVECRDASADVAAWYTAADVVAVPSRWEGMALVPIEAMASGRCVVGFDVAGMSETLGSQDGLVPIGDVDALATAVICRLQNPELAAAEGRDGRVRAERMFDVRTAATRASAATLELLERRSS
jgi:glycosyltransferase involved in cell wall biosynthesis